MSTHIDGLHTASTHVALSTNDELAEHYPGIEESGDEIVLALEAPGNCHLVVVEGDLEEFARAIWKVVFDKDAPATTCDQCDQPATQHWPELKKPVSMCDSCVHDARRSGWEPGQHSTTND